MELPYTRTNTERFPDLPGFFTLLRQSMRQKAFVSLELCKLVIAEKLVNVVGFLTFVGVGGLDAFHVDFAAANIIRKGVFRSVFISRSFTGERSIADKYADLSTRDQSTHFPKPSL